MKTALPADATARAVLRHMLATLAYRAAKVLAGTPADFGARAFGDATRQPTRIVAHMADLMAWGVTLARGEYIWTAGGGDDWDAEVSRFFDGLAALDGGIQSLADGAVEPLIQGPLADALTHVGQLAMLRGRACSAGKLRPRRDRRRTHGPRAGRAETGVRRRRQRALTFRVIRGACQCEQCASPLTSPRATRFSAPPSDPHATRGAPGDSRRGRRRPRAGRP
jgi:hypothetical protein